MPFDSSSLPINGGVVLAGLVYSAVSVVVGQEIGAREIAFSGWPLACEAGIKADLDAQQVHVPKPHERPATDCYSRIGKWHPNFALLCQEFNNPNLELPVEKAERIAREHGAKLKNQQLKRAAKGAASRCECAINIYKRENMIPLALYAGSARLITWGTVADKPAQLSEIHKTSYCANL